MIDKEIRSFSEGLENYYHETVIKSKHTKSFPKNLQPAKKKRKKKATNGRK